ncbi:MAG: glycosyltransferase family 2 protein [Herminiimonas sp.]|uniref:glycosyltransferase family 2 protein n=1 Tax=Herminiimonas sp. TaxID=1926289 RepID=UPI002727AB71|nr:glycosyltransferase family 2 protein [Herminiimonas sp.]MDO9419528.1 glycosyltransferase family 2 protein [Herminiimonas sp.]
MNASVIMTTYNAIEWLEKVLWGLSVQTVSDFEIIIADDGSTAATKERIDALRKLIHIPIVHVWQEDHGFQKTKILNKAILVASSDYLIFTDGDCIPRKDFVETHLKYCEKGYFLSGGYFKLPMHISNAVTKDDILNQRCFNADWLKANGLKISIKILKLTASGFFAKALNALTPTKPTWNGHNASGWKADLLASNGFNEEMQYGGEDRELGERLVNMGLSSKQIRYSAICVHLDHARSYVSEEAWKKNSEIRAFTKANKITRTSHGIKAD